MNIRIKFQKTGAMKFIGHLDIMRYFQKAMRRAHIDIAYSGGFSPHQVMSFAAPLGVGITSDGEYLDIAVHTTRSSADSRKVLNQVMVEGMKVLEYRKLPDTAKPSMALVAAADYTIAPKQVSSLSWSKKELKERLEEFLAQPEIWIRKQTKKSETTLNLKELVYSMRILPESKFFLQVCTGSKTNLKPELVMEAFFQFCGGAYHPMEFQIHRKELYAKASDIPVKGELEREAYARKLQEWKQQYEEEGKVFPRFLPLGELGEEIL